MFGPGLDRAILPGPMIEYLRVRNFKALRDVEVPLRPFTVLVGPNDSGKSSILQALEILGRCSSGTPGPGHEHWTNEPPTPLFGPSPGRLVHRGQWNEHRLDLESRGSTTAGDRKFEYSISFQLGPSSGRVVAETATIADETLVEFQGERTYVVRRFGQYETVDHGTAPVPNPLLTRHLDESDELRAIADALSSQLVCLQPEILAMPNPLSAERSGMERRGYGLAAVIDGLITGPNRRVIEVIERQLHSIVPTIAGVALVTTEIVDPVTEGVSTGKALELVLAAEDNQPPVTIPISGASDGVILALGYLALVHSQTSRCLLIEEPENGLHPSALGFVVDLLQKVSRGELGPGPRQVVLTTHSPLLLNFVEPEDVLIVTRDDDNVRVTPMIDTPDFAERIRDFDLGELWYNVGEANLVK